MALAVKGARPIFIVHQHERIVIDIRPAREHAKIFVAPPSGQRQGRIRAGGACGTSPAALGFRLIEAVAETIAGRILAELRAAPISEVVVRVRKPRVALPGSIDAAMVEIRRRPADS